MQDLVNVDPEMTNEDSVWQPPLILDKGKIEARLFSDEPDPFGP